MAKLFCYYSAMGGSKTANLLVTQYNYKEKGMNPLVFTSSIDSRSGKNKVASRIKGLESDAISIGENDNIFDIVNSMVKQHKQIDVVLVDEASFLKKENIRQLTDIVDMLGISVLAYCLRTDFKGEFFEGSEYLFAWADEIIELKTMCHCGRKANFNARISDGKIVRDGEQIQVGANESYQSLCRKCYKEGKLS